MGRDLSRKAVERRLVATLLEAGADWIDPLREGEARDLAEALYPEIVRLLGEVQTELDRREAEKADGPERRLADLTRKMAEIRRETSRRLEE